MKGSIKKIVSLVSYLAFALFILALDFFTKQWALKTAVKPLIFNKYLSLDLTINRGISWGIFHHADQPFFIALSIGISLLIVLLIAYTLFRWMKDKSIYPELLIIAGAGGNLIDRLMYNGVVDFIALHWGVLAFPIFNVADMAITIGVIGMLVVLPE